MSPKGFLNVVHPHIVKRGSTVEQTVYLTFDDGPDADYTPEVLDVLARKKVSATFFLLGCAAQKNSGLVNRILAEGHELGCHSFSHHHPWSMSSSAARDEVSRGYQALTQISHCAPVAFRPPFGRLRPAMISQARALGMVTVLWTRSGIDWGAFGKPEAIRRRLEKTQAGDILLLHDAPRQKNHPNATLQVLPDVIDHCRDKGLQFRAVSHLIQSAMSFSPTEH